MYQFRFPRKNFDQKFARKPKLNFNALNAFQNIFIIGIFRVKPAKL